MNDDNDLPMELNENDEIQCIFTNNLFNLFFYIASMFTLIKEDVFTREKK